MERSRIEKLITVSLTVKKFFAFCGSRRFIVVFTLARLLPFSWDRSIQSTYSYLFEMYIHISFSYGLQSPTCLFLSDFGIKHFMSLYSLTYMSQAPIYALDIIKAL